MKGLNHENVLNLISYYYTKDSQVFHKEQNFILLQNEIYLNLIMEYIPETLYKIFKSGTTACKFDQSYLKIYIHDLFKALKYIHSLNICHRDIKPQNMLIDPNQVVLKLCDFGSAKQITEADTNISYICSRFYRAPELIYGAIKYSTAVGKQISRIIPNIARYLVRWVCSSRGISGKTHIFWKGYSGSAL